MIETMICLDAGLARECLYHCIKIATWAHPTHERIWEFAETLNLDEIHRTKVIFTPAIATIGTISMRAPTTNDDARSTGMQVRSGQRLARRSLPWV
jgi:hypothetical protein